MRLEAPSTFATFGDKSRDVIEIKSKKIMLVASYFIYLYFFGRIWYNNHVNMSLKKLKLLTLLFFTLAVACLYFTWHYYPGYFAGFQLALNKVDESVVADNQFIEEIIAEDLQSFPQAQGFFTQEIDNLPITAEEIEEKFLEKYFTKGSKEEYKKFIKVGDNYYQATVNYLADYQTASYKAFLVASIVFGALFLFFGCWWLQKDYGIKRYE